MKNKKVLFLTQAAMIGALYVILTHLAALLGLSSGAIQVRISEALTILPAFTPAAIPGLFIGCILANATTGCHIYDILFGSIATLIGAIGTYALRNHKLKFLMPLPPILANMLIVPFIILYVYPSPENLGLPFLVLTVGIGEIITCGVLGMLLYVPLHKNRDRIFQN